MQEAKRCHAESRGILCSHISFLSSYGANFTQGVPTATTMQLFLTLREGEHKGYNEERQENAGLQNIQIPHIANSKTASFRPALPLV